MQCTCKKVQNLRQCAFWLHFYTIKWASSRRPTLVAVQWRAAARCNWAVMVRRPHPALLRSDTISTARPFCLCVCCEALKRRPGEDARNLPYLRIPRSPQSVPNPVWSGWARSHAALKPRGAPGAAGGRFQLTRSASHCLAGRGRSAGYTTLAPHMQLVEVMST